MVGLAIGKRVASPCVLALLPSCVRAFSVCLTDVGFLTSWLPSVLLETVSVCWSFCDFCMSRPVWGCPATVWAPDVSVVWM